MRKEFATKVRRAAWARCEGRCECVVYVDTALPVDIRRPRHNVATQRCDRELQPRRFTFDHRDPDAAGGGNDLDNCQVICPLCDGHKTAKQDAPALASQRARQDKHQGTRKPGRAMPGSVRSGWKRKMDGTVVRR